MSSYLPEPDASPDYSSAVLALATVLENRGMNRG